MLTLDGSQGEGGGQILRTALGLSLLTGRPFKIERIRANRDKPGLRRQHLTAVHAAAQVGRAAVEGAHVDSSQLTFEPQSPQPGEYRFSIGTAGSATLVLQTVLPALLGASGPSRLTLEGGTHNPFAPPFDFLQKAFLPLVSRMGPKVGARLEQPGFYPAGGGRFTVAIEPGPLRPLHLVERGAIRRRTGQAMLVHLPDHIARRELDVVRDGLGWREQELQIATWPEAVGQGNALLLEIESEHVTEVFTGFGQRGVPAERVAGAAVSEAKRYLDADVPVGEHLADQLLIPLAMAGGGSFVTLPPTEHTRTNAGVIRAFLDVEVSFEELKPEAWRVEVRRRS